MCVNVRLYNDIIHILSLNNERHEYSLLVYQLKIINDYFTA